jgi:ABC-type nitrate/sulfonate/bicarbonate transport system substrate-binding protein
MRILFLTLILLAGSIVSLDVSAKQAPDSLPVRVGWQTAWATQGQIAQALKQTGLLARRGLEGDFKGFSYGGPLAEAALAGQVDFAFLGEQPAVNLIARDPTWQIVARLFDTRLAVIVPSESDVKAVADLRGKTLAAPFGSTAHRLALRWLEAAGLVPGRDVKVVNLDIAEQSALVLTGTPQAWKGDVDALVSWDPNVTLFEHQRLARVIEEGSGLAVVVMSQRFSDAHPQAASGFLRALIDAYWYYVKHPERGNKWFLEEARLTLDPTILDKVANYEANMRTERISELRLSFTDEEMQSMQDGAAFGESQGMTSVLPDMTKAVNLRFLEDALRMPAAEPLGVSVP